ncbi:DUF4376 domain-containing protein [Bosea sp. (in: a-proteobacteria)]|uniref:DUF4376 domain-containing protein n=1 Tax=Bosea sp. (in: a-proteobacteria) TaxID=1871050 RepID=UPI001AC92B3F|nr:DUF4376 domain-containing protein [Bosea sp. (in: a-proteobacteria)]MBN9443690.1 DUF4376 domain-containing protein [Bosea sp. (in: a-proteobacteria)]
MRQIYLDSDGVVITCTESNVHDPDALTVESDADWADLLANIGRRKVVSGEIVAWEPPPAPVNLVAYAADRRWRKEVGGIVVADVPVATDDRSKLMITGARVAAMADPGWSTVWHGADGQTYPVDAAAMVLISDAVQAHVNAGFATFATVKAAIEAGTITTTAEIDAAFA